MDSARLPHPIRLSLVVPTLNEAGNIVPFLAAVKAVLDPLLDHEYEVILVDDDSPDRTWEVAGQLLPSFPQLRIVRRMSERELSSAVLRGWQVARGQILGTINADFQHPPQLLAEMLGKIPDSDLVVASRFLESGSMADWSLRRRFAARLARHMGRYLVPKIFKRVSDPLSGCYLIKRCAIEGAEFHPIGFKTLIDVIARARIGKIAECGYVIQPRQYGKSKFSIRNWSRFIIQLHRIRGAIRQ